MKKINVIGTSGSGKSHFSKQLAERMGYPYIELDAIYWQRNWRGIETSDFLKRVITEVNQPYFVLDGNHSKTNEVKWSAVDTVIWLDMGFWLTFWQVLSRSFWRSLYQNEIWQGTGNKESFVRNFLSKDSVILWMLKNYWKTKRKYRALFRSDLSKTITLVRLRTRHEAYEFINNVKNHGNQ
jgi:adenylate kinase family enzyme